jgi:hypothetical protein
MNYIKAICFCIVLGLIGNGAMAQPVSPCFSTPIVSATGSACPGIGAGAHSLKAQGTSSGTTYRWYWRDFSTSPATDNALETFSGDSNPNAEGTFREGLAGRTYFIKTAGGTCDAPNWSSNTATVGSTALAAMSLTSNPANPNLCAPNTTITLTASGGQS